MSVVVSDTSPINYLIQIGEINILPEMFGTVLIPPAVFDELKHAKAPEVVRTWLLETPDWLQVVCPKNILSDLDLDLGETEAISLAHEQSGSLLLIDERKGRVAALRAGVLIAGLLALLDRADKQCLLDFETAVKKLSLTNYRIHRELLYQLVDAVRKRKPQR